MANNPGPRRPANRAANSPSPSGARRRSAKPKGPVTNPLPNSPTSFFDEPSKFGFDDAGLHIPTGNSELLISRRQLMYGAAGLGAAAGVGAVAKAVSDAEAEKNAVHAVVVPSSNVATLDDYTQNEVDSMAYVYAYCDMPYGTLVWCNTDSVAACLVPTKKSKPIAKVAILNINNGTYVTVVDKAQDQKSGFEIYDCRMSEYALVWTESNILQGTWSVWCASVIGMQIGQPFKVASGDSDWELPSLAAVGRHIYWQMRPSAEGNATDQMSTVMTAHIASPNNVKEIYSSNGRFCTPIYASNKGIVITPRHPESRSNYQLTYIGEEDGQVRDTMTLPSLMTPLEAGYGTYGFTFSFTGIYNYGDGIANLGTYTPIQKHKKGEYDNLKWFRFGRTPTVAPCWSRGCFIVKSTTAVAIINPVTKSFCTLSLDNDIENYGDYLASTGMRKRFVTCMNIDNTTTQAASNSSDITKKCLVRTWRVRA